MLIPSNSTGSKIIEKYDLFHQTIRKLHPLSKQQNARTAPSCFPGEEEKIKSNCLHLFLTFLEL